MNVIKINTVTFLLLKGYLIKNGKHFLCFYTVIETRVEFWGKPEIV